MLVEKIYCYLKVVLVILVVVAEAKKKRNRKKEQLSDEPIVEVPDFNICNIKQPTTIYCYCNTMEYNEATEGNCWVFNDTSKKEHSDIWEAFSSQHRIKHLTLHLRPDGTVKTIPTIAVMHLNELEWFEIQYATIDSVHPFAFGNSTTVEKISLSRNAIAVLEASALSNMPKLTSISLGENQLTEINRDVFVGLPKLTKLFIDRNNITRIADYAFHNLQNLKELELFSNQIRVIVPVTFIGLEKLERLYLHKNWIEVIGDKTFQYLKALKVLDLHGNSIKFIAPKGLYGLGNLQKIYLQDNKLLSLGSEVFIGKSKLSYLDLRQNVLDTITEDTIKPLKKMLQQSSMVLLLKGNIFRCDTRLLWMFTVYNTTKSRSVKDSLEEMHCYLETGTLPPRFDPLSTPNYEVTTLGIGPRAQLMKLLPSELPDPLLKTPATFTKDEDCEHEKPTQKTKSKKMKGGGRRKMRMKNHRMSITTNAPIAETTAIVETIVAQNDMAESYPKKKERKSGSSPEAAPVQESMAYNNEKPESSTNRPESLFWLQMFLLSVCVFYSLPTNQLVQFPA